MSSNKLLYFVVITLMTALALLFEYDILPRAVVPDDPATTYTLNLLVITLSLGGCFLLLYWFRLPMVVSRMASAGEETAGFVSRQHTLRILLWGVLSLIAIGCYYLAPYVHNALYGILILLIAGVFCWPAGTGDNDRS